MMSTSSLRHRRNSSSAVRGIGSIGGTNQNRPVERDRTSQVGGGPREIVTKLFNQNEPRLDGGYNQEGKHDENFDENEEDLLSSSSSSFMVVTRCMTVASSSITQKPINTNNTGNSSGTNMNDAPRNKQQNHQQFVDRDKLDTQEQQEVEPCSSTTTINISDDSSSSSSSSSSGRDSIIVWSPQEIQSRPDAEHELYNYLYKNLMPFDVPNAQSLGFHNHDYDDDNDDNLPDGLSDGIVAHTISIALDARQLYPWTSHVPKNIYFEYVGGFASVNEARNNWRPLFKDVVDDILQPLWLKQHETKDDVSVEDAVREINQNLWDKFYTRKPIYFQSGKTPLIYDPMSIIAYGYASCTGLSIFLIDALRTAGIPARLAGTPAWNGNKDSGNHSWVEFYGSDSQWHIMEAKPASGGEDIDLWDPCQWWFCNEGRMENTNVFAARLDRSCDDGGGGSIVFPLAWDSKNDDVMGEDRTDFMRDLCSQCK
jgi:hypothetical protein